ncbi:ROK family protein [Nonomuraea sp. JJY05]|uniref:ROK family transcriptional regulator n=1 Tax=Nonomuraea sp. JJY05 TaxID=3350255 RepID=UPI00373FBED0
MNAAAKTKPHASSKAVVLDAIRAAGTISRAGLVGATGFTGPTITAVVRKLIEEGLVVESGRAESTGGKRRILLRLDHSARYAVGVHLDHGGMVYVLTDLAGAVVTRMAKPGVGVEEPGAAVEAMAREISGLIDSAGAERHRVLGVGVVFADAGFPLSESLEQATGLPVVLDNEATAAALGEHWAGGFGGASAAAALYLGTRISAGLVINGITYRGPGGKAGDLAHVCVQADGPRCRCGARGCLDVLAGPAAVVAAARADLLVPMRRSREPSVAADFAALSRSARRGEPRALALLERSARYIAAAARTLSAIMDLQVLVLTGPGFSIAGSVYLPVIEKELSPAVDVRLSRLAATASAVGAAALVLESELVPLSLGARLPENLSSEAIH